MGTHKPAIDPSKGQVEPSLGEEHNAKIEDREREISVFMDYLCKPSNSFSEKRAFDLLFNYIIVHGRILYSTISNIIYEMQNGENGSSSLATLMANINALLSYSEDVEKIDQIKNCLSEGHTTSMVDNTRKAVLKIWDHITLAYQQYAMLKQSDEEYDEKFKARIASYKEEMIKEMNAQMITMVGIFTALAFLVFGSISSLDGIFEQNEIPLFKVMSVALVWGLCILNLIFVFLFCIGKMTKLSFKSNDHSTATIFERYPIVWWTNLSLISLLALTLWGYFVQQNGVGNFFVDMCGKKPVLAFTIGSICIVGLIVLAFLWLGKKTGRNSSNE